MAASDANRGRFPKVTSGAHLFPEFERRATAVAGEVYRVADPAAATRTLLELVAAAGVRKAVVAPDPQQRAAGIVEALRSAGVAVHTDAAEIAVHAESADIGISWVEFGVAETGSVFQDGTGIADRLVTILPPLHLVFLASGSIVPGIVEAFEIIAQGFDSGYAGFITGPSRTADIERVLTIGVHGPGRFAIVAIDDEAPGREER